LFQGFTILRLTPLWWRTVWRPGTDCWRT